MQDQELNFEVSDVLSKADILVNQIITELALPKLGFCQCSDLTESVFELSTRGCDAFRDRLVKEEKPVLDVVWARFVAGKTLTRGLDTEEAKLECSCVYNEQLAAVENKPKEEMIDLILSCRMEHVKAFIAWNRYGQTGAVVTFDESLRNRSGRIAWQRRV